MLLEREMFKIASAVIVENDWCEDICKCVNPNLSVFRNIRSIKKGFYQYQWSIDNINRQTIFTNAGGYPIKGHHILFKALSIVKQKYPNFKCYILGTMLSTYNATKRRNGYIQYLIDLIEDGKLSDNIVYTGFLSMNQMIESIIKSNVYVMPSIVENHSSSLIEAMILGAPSISSLVGVTASLIQQKKNGILYNSLDAESLAGNIIRVFENDELVNSLSREALNMRTIRKQNFGTEMLHVYQKLVSLQ